MRVRPAVGEDAPVLAALEEMLFGPDAWSEAVVAGELAGPGRHAVVAVEGLVAGGVDDGADGLVSGAGVVGYAVTMRSDDVVDLQRIGVHPEHQRCGVARAMLDEVLSAATSDGADRMLLEVSADNAAALAFYAGAGFVEIDRRRRYYRDGSDAVVMRRSLRRVGCGGRG